MPNHRLAKFDFSTGFVGTMEEAHQLGECCAPNPNGRILSKGKPIEAVPGDLNVPGSPALSDVEARIDLSAETQSAGRQKRNADNLTEECGMKDDKCTRGDLFRN